MEPIQSMRVSSEGMELVNHLRNGQVTPFEVIVDSIKGEWDKDVNMHIRLSPAFCERMLAVLRDMDFSERVSDMQSKEEAFKEGVLLGASIVMSCCEPSSGQNRM